MSTAICARLAASATSVKSLRKVSVEDDPMRTGCGGTILVEGDCCVVDNDDVWCDGDVIGAFILDDVLLWYDN